MTQEKKIIVAIDGFSSSGKSSMAKALARNIGYRYIDSGAMYRAVTLYALQHELIAADGSIDKDSLIAALPSISIDFAITPDGQHTLLNGIDVERDIRSMEVSSQVSHISAIPEVRKDLTLKQQAYGREKGIVMDGRDIGTTVFPDAELKIYVNASAETRAQRRLAELLAKGMEATYDDVLRNVRERDHIDTTREVSPLRRASDAVDLDNSGMTIEQQDACLLDLFNKTIAAL
ncbi:MAG: (d)CMP kinase [Muribaculaceae bacterium]|nr:(d)CMP kinase [Muribaculaceae bacterium]MCF0214523.1 (d)CMP kinase [Muribaculaceae bacterium]